MFIGGLVVSLCDVADWLVIDSLYGQDVLTRTAVALFSSKLFFNRGVD
jgi:hypothetical protein